MAPWDLELLPLLLGLAVWYKYLVVIFSGFSYSKQFLSVFEPPPSLPPPSSLPMHSPPRYASVKLVPTRKIIQSPEVQPSAFTRYNYMKVILIKADHAVTCTGSSLF